MAEREIIEELKKLTPAERLSIVEATLRSIREELTEVQKPLKGALKNRMAVAAKALMRDYTQGGDLTSFTALDSEDFHAEG
ncbi:MAG: hypothetical protein AB1512_04080 [Thermodesulfobacteriota bacterium]